MALTSQPTLPGAVAQPVMTEDQKRQKALEDYRKKLIEHRELDAKLKKSMCVCVFYA